MESSAGLQSGIHSGSVEVEPPQLLQRRNLQVIGISLDWTTKKLDTISKPIQCDCQAFLNPFLPDEESGSESESGSEEDSDEDSEEDSEEDEDEDEESEEEEIDLKCPFCGLEKTIYANGDKPESEEFWATLQKPKGKKNEGYIVFCIDSSLSMGEKVFNMDPKLSKKILEEFPLNTNENRITIQELDPFCGYNQKNLPTLFQCVQFSLSKTIEELAKKEETKNFKAIIINFSQDVQIHCAGHSTIILSDRSVLKDKNKIISKLESFKATAPIGESVKELKDTIKKIAIGGMTCLGPAILSSVTIAKSIPGSRILLFSDGVSNIGVGKLTSRKVSKPKHTSLYTELGKECLSNGIIVDTFTLRNQQCMIKHLGQLSLLSGGKLKRVAPQKVIKCFSSAIKNQIFGYHADLRVYLPKSFEIINKDSKASNPYAEGLGNLTSWCYQAVGFRKKENQKSKQMHKIPIQICVLFKTLDGGARAYVCNKTIEIPSLKPNLWYKNNWDAINKVSISRITSMLENPRNLPNITELLDSINWMYKKIPEKFKNKGNWEKSKIRFIHQKKKIDNLILTMSEHKEKVEKEKKIKKENDKQLMDDLLKEDNFAYTLHSMRSFVWKK
ncbi:hypothetical protein M0813_26267 [Anaeramoeba flamelloides]|uniref:Sec23/Sec24 trunk domain-containing protein n=1 Tax=Anaeramoeba flamelloides TaxID=1746091 RepID=A0ABQ8Y0B3_9EUKA|nr:hypothetical protein M0813_26267 [Anaeramoeba flamelloides]